MTSAGKRPARDKHAIPPGEAEANLNDYVEVKPKRAIGRPSSFVPALADRICEQLALGRSLRDICREDAIPHIATVMSWLNKRPEFHEQYARARELQAEYLFDEIVEIADDATNDYMQDKGNDGYLLIGEAINRSRLRIDARKWAASKMAPKKYGDRSSHEFSGPDGGPIQHIGKIVIEVIG
jgi:hypothetical protein